ncbi:hypothetical protein ACAX43_12410 [Paraburkholderia sp. IW21]|uniref:phage adaptor protein n=1 Tax=Paraburkholderia sp. IW21 TaxID=3242488 RepID=UPI00351FC266
MSNLSFDSYDDFQNVVATYLQRANLTAQIPVFIELAEARLKTLLQTLDQQIALPYSVTPSVGTNVIALPSDFGAMLHATYDDCELNYVSPEQIDKRKWNQYAQEYTITGNKLILQTYVDGTSELTMYYYATLLGLSDANESNWVLEDYPNIYLYATLFEAVTYIKDDEEMQKWQGMLSEAVTEAQQASRIGNVPQKTKLTRRTS